MQLGEVLNVVRSTDRLKIKSQSSDAKTNLLYIGYKGLFDFEAEEVKAAGLTPALEVTNINYGHELRDKHWKENGLTEPMEPKSVPNHIYADLEERIYMIIRVNM